jgi:hypothetical protein
MSSKMEYLDSKAVCRYERYQYFEVSGSSVSAYYRILYFFFKFFIYFLAKIWPIVEI